MAGLVPAIHVFLERANGEVVDHRVKPGDDGLFFGRAPLNSDFDSVFKQPRATAHRTEAREVCRRPRAPNWRGEGRWSAARRNIVVVAPPARPCEGRGLGRAHRLAALHRRCGPVQKLHPRRADVHEAANCPMPSAAAFFSGRGSAQVWNGMWTLAASQSDASSALSRRVLRSAPRRKRQLPVVGAGGSTSASRVAVCVTSRAGAALHSALKNASGQRPSRMKR